MTDESEIGVDDSTTGQATAQSRAQALIGRVVSDRYRIVELVAMGGMGAIFRAEHLLMHKQVAIKVLHPQIEGFPDLVARFEREAVAGAHIQHPNVAAASDFGKFDGGSCFLVLEYIEGETLRDALKAGAMPAPVAASIAKQLASALAAVHDKGIVHRDLKPLNVMLLKSGGSITVKLIDFGLAKVPIDQLSALARDADPARRSLTAAGVVMGTVAYIAPEAALGMRSVGPRSDLYSLGVLFYEMLAGKHPFDGVDAKTLFSQHRSEKPRPIRERSPDVAVPEALERVVMRLLEKEPEARYESAEEVQRAIDDAMAPPKPKPPAPPQELETVVSLQAASPGAKGSRRGLVAAAVVGAVLVLGLAVFIATRGSSSPAPSASAPAEASAEPPAATVQPRGPAAPVAKSAREKLRVAIDTGDPKRAGAVLGELIGADPGAFRDRAVQTEAAEAAQLAASVEDASIDDLFERVASKLGADGLDVLYDLVARETNPDPAQRVGLTRPKSAPARAKALLARPDMIAHASAPMRIALDLRRTPCSSRPGLFARAGKDGDDRALQILLSMQPPACSPKSGEVCCFPDYRQLDRTIADIQARLRR